MARRVSIEKQLRTELTEALAQLHELSNAPANKARRVAASVEHATLMARIWSLRFQIANAELDKAREPVERINAERMMRLASMQASDWEKRKGSAKNSKADILDDSEDHDAQQQQAADDLAALH